MQNQAEYWDTILDPKNISASASFDLETELAFYRTPAQEYAYQLMGYGTTPEVGALLAAPARLGRASPAPTTKKILELGGGMGINAVILARAGAEVTVIDISSNRVKWMQRLAEQTQLQDRIEVNQMSAEQLSFPENSFDIVYSNAVLIHVNKEQVAQEVVRVLNPGGSAIFVEPLQYHPLVNLYRYTFAPRIWREIAEYFSFHDLEKLGKHFSRFSHQEFYLFSFLSFFWEFGKRNLPRFQRSISRWQKLDESLLRKIPSLSKLCWFTVFCGTK
ncbi:MAG: class I SAM-dependent methyltransferase [bacterium]|nr:class I SAM-dependent methyltransferase [bacterium]